MPRTVLSPRPLQTSKYNFLQPADGARCADWHTLFELFISFCTQDENNRVCVGRRIQHPNLLDSTTEHLFYQACLYPPTHCSLCPEARNRITRLGKHVGVFPHITFSQPGLLRCDTCTPHILHVAWSSISSARYSVELKPGVTLVPLSKGVHILLHAYQISHSTQIQKITLHF